MSGQIKVDFAHLQGTHEDVVATVSAMNTAFADLHSYLAPMTAAWHGAAAQAYLHAQREWDRAAGDLNAVLAALGRALAAATEGFRATEVQNAARFA